MSLQQSPGLFLIAVSLILPLALAAAEKSGNNEKFEEELKFWPAFVNSISMIIATEIGDKTFFIAAVLSMRSDRLAVFSGAILALICMTVLSTLMGLVLPSLMPRKYTHIMSGFLFLYFGIKLVYESLNMEHKVSDELEEVEEELCLNSKKQDVESLVEKQQVNGDVNVPAQLNASDPMDMWVTVFVKSLSLTFLAEWGDRSQIATIALSSSKDPYGVTIGGCIGHAMCTGMACLGGRYLASKISEKTVSLCGGITFCIFGLHAFIFGE
eukprot:CAMPEP_0116010260 /NCGR_PEP_ID=MMETSP0321-20121206/3902_1 /TAXON_ID=163516 /ORGANISM="Leptocylindrus danicus var. danicus, Strain B650" /LENGTH=268 /DNA_ID=CAMNT_0003479339 /DNA_START=11 /DNA_END=817 /DNA_ORIENTATION=-